MPAIFVTDEKAIYLDFVRKSAHPLGDTVSFFFGFLVVDETQKKKKRFKKMSYRTNDEKAMSCHKKFNYCIQPQLYRPGPEFPMPRISHAYVQLQLFLIVP